uniref:fructose-bisphosphate aldolase n=1 Tax=Chlamydomonas leiostraca TaxID=1034604 RepID=A0A7S0WS82_9CHLO|mmetsp:Transcript_25055/g.63518  ORF Transcript_25055/g.63518 Transcript_25055/m.63518 type:complete len:283 (+) Transcript_25055:1-849(+)
MVAVLNEQGIAPGIKVDEGLVPLEGGLEGETWTKGLENLAAAAREYKAQGAEFAKWRATIKVQQGGPSDKAIERNAEDLASYAAICQVSGLVPIVEPEILIDGHHDIGRFQAVTERVIAETFTHMWRKGVHLEGALLKPQMVIPGADYAGGKATPEEVAHHTVTALRRVVPPALPGILFLSGGQSEEEATLNLNAINVAARQMGRAPWSLSFSYGRALQHSVLKTWAANQAAVADAQAMALALAEANSRAALGNYSGPHPTTASTESLRENFRGWSGAAPAH